MRCSRRSAVPCPGPGRRQTEVIEDLARDADPGSSAIAGPRYFGFVIGGSLPAALAADWLTSTWDQNAGLYAVGPAASVVEEVVGAWLVDLLGLPAGTSVGLTTGCQMAHFTCLAAARHAVLERVGWDVEERRPVRRAADHGRRRRRRRTPRSRRPLQFLGLGRSRVDHGRRRRPGPHAAWTPWRATLPAGDGPLIVCAQAGQREHRRVRSARTGDRRSSARAHRTPGSTSTARSGCGRRPARRYRHLAAGHDGADSWATDAHKWLNVPYDCGYRVRARRGRPRRGAVAARRRLLRRTARRSATSSAGCRSTRAGRAGSRSTPRSASLGRDGVARPGRALLPRSPRAWPTACAAAGDGVEVLNDVVLNQVLVRFAPPATAADADAMRTREVIARGPGRRHVLARRHDWHGMAAMRISVVNWSTTEDDIDRSVAAILRAARGVAESAGSTGTIMHCLTHGGLPALPPLGLAARWRSA